MPVTKHYFFSIKFERGTAEFTDKRPTGVLWDVVVKAACIPEHRIIIETHEDRTDPCEAGLAMRRLEAMRQLYTGKSYVAASVDAQRLEMQVHAPDCCMESRGEFARRAEIHLFPRIASLFPDGRDEFLSESEVYALEDVRCATYKDVDTNCKELEDQHPTVEWKRILGHESLREWIKAGGYHPYFVSLGLEMGRRFS